MHLMESFMVSRRLFSVVRTNIFRRTAHHYKHPSLTTCPMYGNFALSVNLNNRSNFEFSLMRLWKELAKTNLINLILSVVHFIKIHHKFDQICLLIWQWSIHIAIVKEPEKILDDSGNTLHHTERLIHRNCHHPSCVL